MNETWIKIDGFRGYYEVSDMGRVRSNNRLSSNRLLKQMLKKNGYLQVGLQDGDKITWRLVSRIVYESFNGKTDLHIDHVNEDKTDNRLCNLQAITVRDNNIKSKRHNKTSKYPGVHLTKTGKWKAQIGKDGKKIGLGYFVDELDAYNAYVNAIRL